MLKNTVRYNYFQQYALRLKAYIPFPKLVLAEVSCLSV